MNHLTPEMTYHYFRKEMETNKEKSKIVLRGIILGDFKLIGEEAENLIKKIDEFIKNNNFNIKKDLDTIINELADAVPIREKIEGYCVKSSFGKVCKYNEFLCAFEICPNQCTNFLFSDISYRRYQDTIKIIKYNEKNGFIKEASVEKNKMKRWYETYFSKELIETKNEILRQGADTIIEKYPNLEYVVHNIDCITDECEKWIKENVS